MGQEDVQRAKKTCSGPRRRPVGQRDVQWAKDTCTHETHWGGVFSSNELQSSNEDSNFRTKIPIRRLYLL